MLPTPSECGAGSDFTRVQSIVYVLQENEWVTAELLIMFLFTKKLPVAFYQSDDRTLPDADASTRMHCGYVLRHQTGTVRKPAHRCIAPL